MKALELCGEGKHPVYFEGSDLLCLDMYENSGQYAADDRLTGPVGAGQNEHIEVPSERIELPELATPLLAWTVSAMTIGVVIGRLARK